MLSIIVPTLGNRLIEMEELLNSLALQKNQQFEVICAIQGNFEAVNNLLNRYSFPIKIINLNKRGLSFARNEALKLVKDDTKFVTLSDDDCWYPPDSVDRVLELGKDFKGCLCFQIFDPKTNQYYKNYNGAFDENISLRKSLKVSSIEIFISKEIIDSGIRFDERFGLGTNYPSGEENIFLFDIIKNGWTIKYFPEVIVFHLKPNWKNKEYIFKGKGALFARLYNKPLAYIMVNLYAIMKSKYSDNLLMDIRNMIAEIRTFNIKKC